MKPLPIYPRFYAKFIVHPRTRCWIWTSKKSRNKRWDKPYGILSCGSTFKTAHRISWRLHHGEIPFGLYVLHHCDNPLCVNPEHLFLGTQQDNLDDMKRKQRSQAGAKHWNWKGGISDQYRRRNRLSS